MSRTLRNGRVELELGTGAWRARWADGGVRAGPFEATVTSTGEERRSSGAAGSWRLETTGGGARARWLPRGDTPGLELALGVDDPVVTATASYRAASPGTLARLTPLVGPVDPMPERRLVEGYDSWAYAGVRAGPGDSYWRAVLASGDAALGVQARGAARWCTRITVDEEVLRVDCGATPGVRQASGTWGYEVLPPGSLALPLAAGDEVRSEPIAIAAGHGAAALAERLAAMVGPRPWRGAPITGWESWYHYGLLIDADALLANARVLRDRRRDRPGFDLVQLDDGWQVTYGAWWPNDRFPDPLAALTDELHALGLRAGLWLAPFMVQPGAPGLGTDHTDWVIGGLPDGEPLLDRHRRWSLDASHPDVLAFLHDLGAQVRAWGFEMVKLDFCYLGAQEGTRHDPRVTGTQALRAGLRAFVDGLGDEVYVLGCGIPLLPAVGLCHGSRIGHDLAIPVLLREFGQPLADGWTGWAGIKAQARQLAARAALHGRWFDCDPDVVMAWGSDGRGGPDGYSLEESRTLAVLAALCGGPFLLADDLAALTPAERAVLEDPRLLDLAWDARGARPLDVLDHVDTPAVEHAFAQPRDLPSTWVAERGSGSVVALFNWTDEPAARTAPDGRRVEVPPHGVRLLDG